MYSIILPHQGHFLIELLNFDYKLFRKFKNVQLPLDYKKKKSQFVIKNDFTKKTITKYVKYILQQIQK